jgi:hypothetical protein
VLIRNLSVPYNDPAGYPVDQPAPLQLALFNQTADEVRVTVTSSKPADGTTAAGALTGASVSLSGPADSASPAPTDSATPSEAPAQPAVITLAPHGTASFLPGDPQSLQVSGLPKELAPGGSVYVTFTFSNGTAPLTVPAPVGVPASPASRAPGVPSENVEE